jgi:condensin-2 complex subunit G2
MVRGWKESNGGARLQIESLWQELFLLSLTVVHPGTFRQLRHLTDTLLAGRKVPGVPELISRILHPVLPRLLSSSEPRVRVHALTLLGQAFPLSEPWTLNPQLDTLTLGLHDPSDDVRVTAVKATCRILSQFWELFPEVLVKRFCMTLVNELAWDSGSVRVRVSVLEGLTFLLDLHLSRALLFSLLPSLKPLIHDKAEHVRLAFLALLARVRTVPGIKFWQVVPLEDLLARLAIDCTTVRQKVSALLAHSYLPNPNPNPNPALHLQRCLLLLQALPL